MINHNEVINDLLAEQDTLPIVKVGESTNLAALSADDKKLLWRARKLVTALRQADLPGELSISKSNGWRTNIAATISTENDSYYVGADVSAFGTIRGNVFSGEGVVEYRSAGDTASANFPVNLTAESAVLRVEIYAALLSAMAESVWEQMQAQNPGVQASLYRLETVNNKGTYALDLISKADHFALQVDASGKVLSLAQHDGNRWIRGVGAMGEYMLQALNKHLDNDSSAVFQAFISRLEASVTHASQIEPDRFFYHMV